MGQPASSCVRASGVRWGLWEAVGGRGHRGPWEPPLLPSQTPRASAGWGWEGCWVRALWGDCVNGGEERADAPLRFPFKEREPRTGKALRAS